MTDDPNPARRRPTPRVQLPVSPDTSAQPATGQEAYSSSIVAPMQIALGVVSGAVVAAILIALNTDLWPIAVLIFLIAAGVGVYLAPVSVAIDGKYVTIAQGRRERDPLSVYLAEIRDAGLRDLTWAQCLGFGDVESDDRTTRLAVRPGTTLVLSLFDGQRLLVSVTDGHAAMRAIKTTHH